MSARLFAGVLASALLCACPSSNVKPDAGHQQQCQTRDDCQGGKICTKDHFCDNCDSSGQCTVREECKVDTHLCGLRAGWGNDCATNDQCQAGSWCMQGLCQDRSQVTLCLSGNNSDCPQGDRCNKVNFVCEEDLGCSLDEDCSALEVCNTGSRQCVPRCTADTQAQLCAAGERCINSMCSQCATDADCGVGLVCDPAGRCSSGARCYTDRDCKVPLVCFVQTGACLPKAAPCVTNDACTADQRCEVTSGKCVPKTCQPDHCEVNDTMAQAYNVATGAQLGLTLCQGDVDWFSINLARGDQLGVNLDADPFSENTFSTAIKDGTGRTLAGGHLLVSYVAAVPATYYVVVSTTDVYQPYAANFLMSRGTPCDDDNHEPNDTLAQATAFNTASQLDGIICPQDQDWFSAGVPAAHGFTVSLTNYDSSKGLLRLCAFAADGVTQYGCTEDPVAPVVTVPAAQAGAHTVLVRVLGSTDRVSNGYTVSVGFP